MPWHPIFRSIPVVGCYFRSEEEQMAAKALTHGAPVALVLEPENEHDNRAVAVHTPGGQHIGYIPAHSSGAVYALAELVEAEIDTHAYVTKVSSKGWPVITVVVGDES